MEREVLIFAIIVLIIGFIDLYNYRKWCKKQDEKYNNEFKPPQKANELEYGCDQRNTRMCGYCGTDTCAYHPNYQ